LKLDNV
jgi:ATP-dependent RNA helicase DDX19/DBP5